METKKESHGNRCQNFKKYIYFLIIEKKKKKKGEPLRDIWDAKVDIFKVKIGQLRTPDITRGYYQNQQKKKMESNSFSLFHLLPFLFTVSTVSPNFSFL